MALDFPNAPTNNQVFTDATTGEQWKYELATNSWTSLGLTTSGGIVYKGGLSITAAPPAGVASGWTYTVTTGGTPNAGFTGLTGTIAAGSQVTFDGANWQVSGSSGPWTRTGTVVSPANAGDLVAVAALPTATATAAGIVQLADAAAITAGTAGRVVDAARLKAIGALGTRNAIINGMVDINQRGVTIAAAAVGAYGPDRWKKVDATNMTQIIEDVNVVHGVKYTLSWKGGTPQVLTAPAIGHWTLPNIPITATEVQLELGEVATPFERRFYGQELLLCQRYFYTTSKQPVTNADGVSMGSFGYRPRSAAGIGNNPRNFFFPTVMRASPTVTVSAFGYHPTATVNPGDSLTDVAPGSVVMSAYLDGICFTNNYTATDVINMYAWGIAASAEL